MPAKSDRESAFIRQSEQHTPGPWTCHVMTRDVEVEAPCGRTIWMANIEADDNTIADGRLIAAAPDLLLACRQAINALKGREHDGFLRDAIAKATGQQP
jgi:hypothetical protein